MPSIFVMEFEWGGESADLCIQMKVVSRGMIAVLFFDRVILHVLCSPAFAAKFPAAMGW